MYLLLSMVIGSLSATFAQSLSGPSSCKSNEEIELTGVGEKQSYSGQTWYSFYNTSGIDNNSNVGVSPAPATGRYTTNTVVGSSFFANTSSATKIKVRCVNPLSYAITVTFYIKLSYYTGSLSGGNSTVVDKEFPYTITINPDPGAGSNTFVPSLGQGGTTTNYIYRLFHRSSASHFYTTSYSEYANLAGNSAYKDEGAIGFAYKTQQAGTVLLRRFVANNGEHMYTIDSNEANSLLNGGWHEEGPLGYVYSGQVSESIPVYRYVARYGTGGHFFTTNFNELGSGNSAYQYEGIAYFALNQSH